MFSRTISATKRGSSKLTCFSSSGAIMDKMCFITSDVQLAEVLFRRSNRFLECAAEMSDSAGPGVEAIRISKS